MATYKKVYESRVPYERGMIVQRFYDKITADLLLQNYVRTHVRARKILRKPLQHPLRRKLKLPIIRRVQEE